MQIVERKPSAKPELLLSYELALLIFKKWKEKQNNVLSTSKGNNWTILTEFLQCMIDIQLAPQFIA